MAKNNSGNNLASLSGISPVYEKLKDVDRINPGRVAVAIPIKNLYAAPSEWNFYSKHKEDKKVEVMNAIHKRGLDNPITVWKKPKDAVNEFYENHTELYNFGGTEYMVLLGHNRTDSTRDLNEATGDVAYETILAFVYQENELTPEKAHEIIVDDNYLNRVLTLEEKTRAVMHKYANNPDEDVTKLAEKLNMSAKSVRRYVKLGTMNEGIRKRVFSAQIGLTQAVKIAGYTSELQGWIEKEYGERLNNEIIAKFRKSHQRKQIEELFSQELDKEVTVSIKVPAHLKSKFEEMAKNWIKNHRKKDIIL